MVAFHPVAARAVVSSSGCAHVRDKSVADGGLITESVYCPHWAIGLAYLAELLL